MFLELSYVSYDDVCRFFFYFLFVLAEKCDQTRCKSVSLNSLKYKLVLHLKDVY